MTPSFNKLLVSATAEVAGSSPVVPAIHSKRVSWKWRNPKGHKKDTVLGPVCVPNALAKPSSEIPVELFPPLTWNLLWKRIPTTSLPPAPHASLV